MVAAGYNEGALWHLDQNRILRIDLNNMFDHLVVCARNRPYARLPTSEDGGVEVVAYDKTMSGAWFGRGEDDAYAVQTLSIRTGPEPLRDVDCHRFWDVAVDESSFGIGLEVSALVSKTSLCHVVKATGFDIVLAHDPNWIFINSWNEWWENSHIEPSELYGTQYLDITREYANRWKGE